MNIEKEIDISFYLSHSLYVLVYGPVYGSIINLGILYVNGSVYDSVERSVYDLVWSSVRGQSWNLLNSVVKHYEY